MSKLSAEQLVKRDHVWLMRNPKYCLYSGIIMLGNTEVRDDIPTACTNGRDVYYGRKFVSKLSDQARRGLILHENLHKAFRHLTMWKHLYEEDAQLANMACDYVINLMIHDSDPHGTDVALPEGGLLDKQYRGMDAATVYKLLRQQKQQQKQQGGSGADGDSGGSLDQHDWSGAETMTEQDREQLAREVDQALRQGAMLAGKISGNVPREVSDLLKPKVDWRAALRDFITSTCQDRDTSTWRRPSRRWIGQDVYMPSVVGESVGRIVLAIDTSGSIGAVEIGQFLSEVQTICQTVTPEGIDLLYWGTAVCQHEKYERDQLDCLMTSTKPRGGGGTDPQCLVDYMAAHRMRPECCVILTDGYVGSWGKGWTCPTLWGITTDIVSGVGKTVKVK